MARRTYRAPRVQNGDLRTRIIFFTPVSEEGPMPGVDRYEMVYETWAKIDSVWMRDLELAKASGTASDLTITIRDAGHVFIPTNKHIIQIEDPLYAERVYNVKEVQPDMQARDFLRIVAGASTWE